MTTRKPQRPAAQCTTAAVVPTRFVVQPGHTVTCQMATAQQPAGTYEAGAVLVAGDVSPLVLMRLLTIGAIAREQPAEE